jgi:hypothetical protein
MLFEQRASPSESFAYVEAGRRGHHFRPERPTGWLWGWQRVCCREIRPAVTTRFGPVCISTTKIPLKQELKAGRPGSGKPTRHIDRQRKAHAVAEEGKEAALASVCTMGKQLPLGTGPVAAVISRLPPRVEQKQQSHQRWPLVGQGAAAALSTQQPGWGCLRMQDGSCPQHAAGSEGEGA